MGSWHIWPPGSSDVPGRVCARMKMTSCTRRIFPDRPGLSLRLAVTLPDAIVSVSSGILIQGFLGKGHVKVMKKIVIKVPVSAFFEMVVVL